MNLSRYDEHCHLSSLQKKRRNFSTQHQEQQPQQRQQEQLEKVFAPPLSDQDKGKGTPLKRKGQFFQDSQKSNNDINHSRQQQQNQEQEGAKRSSDSFLPTLHHWDNLNQDDDDNGYDHTSSSSRLTTMKTAAHFYDESHKMGIPATELHQAVVESHAQHERWWIRTQPKYSLHQQQPRLVPIHGEVAEWTAVGDQGGASNDVGLNIDDDRYDHYASLHHHHCHHQQHQHQQQQTNYDEQEENNIETYGMMLSSSQSLSIEDYSAQTVNSIPPLPKFSHLTVHKPKHVEEEENDFLSRPKQRQDLMAQQQCIDTRGSNSSSGKVERHDIFLSPSHLRTHDFLRSDDTPQHISPRSKREPISDSSYSSLFEKESHHKRKQQQHYEEGGKSSPSILFPFYPERPNNPSPPSFMSSNENSEENDDGHERQQTAASSAPIPVLVLDTESTDEDDGEYYYTHDDNDEYSSDSTQFFAPNSIPSRIFQNRTSVVVQAKQQLLQALAISKGDMDCPKVRAAMEPLFAMYKRWSWDARAHDAAHRGYPGAMTIDHPQSVAIEGMWLALSKPTYEGNMGLNQAGEPMYTLGRMSFDMLCPNQLVCSIQGTFNPVEKALDHAVVESVPKSLRKDLERDDTLLRSYNIVTAFTVEPYHPDLMPNAIFTGHTENTKSNNSGCPNVYVRRPIKGILTIQGYVLPDPDVANRLSIWFTGGCLEVNDDDRDVAEWMRFFSPSSNPSCSKRSFVQAARLLAAKFLLGAEIEPAMQEDGSRSFVFRRPIGGHGLAYVDVMYMDESLRIVRGHKGTYFVFVRVPKH